MRLLLIGFIVLILATAAAAQTKHTWDRVASGTCPLASQCLVNPAYSDTYNEQPARYFSETFASNKPKCIANGQYILDNYCENGSWTSRTKHVAQQLVSLSLTSQQPFTLICGTPDETLNRYIYQTPFGLASNYLLRFCQQVGNLRTENCANNICVLAYGSRTALGFSINTNIDSEQSPLKALGFAPTLCNFVKNNDGDFDLCANNIWYNHDTQSIIYAPNATSLPPVDALAVEHLTAPFAKLRDYAMRYTAPHNYSFYTEPAYSSIALAKTPARFAFAFKQAPVTQTQTSYAGWYFANYNIPADACPRYIKRYDDLATCEQQPNPSEFITVSYHNAVRPSQLVTNWLAPFI